MAWALLYLHGVGDAIRTDAWYSALHDSLDRHGIEPRHLRALRQSADRDVALIESALAPLRRRTDATSRGRAAEVAPELARRLAEVRDALIRTALDRLDG